MGDLSNKLIRQTFDGLIKTNDEDPITSTPKRLQDGVGNDLPVEVALGGMVYYGTQDFTNATVTGISGGGGTAGSSGTSGTSGSSGVDGPAGPTGPAGTSGTSGTSAAGGAESSFAAVNSAAPYIWGTRAAAPFFRFFMFAGPSSPNSSTLSGFAPASGYAYSLLTHLKPGQKIDRIMFGNAVASAGATLQMALYDTRLVTEGNMETIEHGTRLVDFGTDAIDLSTTGWKILEGINYTVPTTSTTPGTYILVIYATFITTVSLTAGYPYNATGKLGNTFYNEVIYTAPGEFPAWGTENFNFTGTVGTTRTIPIIGY